MLTPFRLVGCLLGLCGVTAGPLAAADGKLHFIGVSFNGDPGPRLTVDEFNFSTLNVLERFQEQSGELFTKIEAKTFLGAAAKKDDLFRHLALVARRAQPQDLVVFQFGSHGGTSRADGWGAGLADGAIYGSELREALSHMKCPTIAMISTCGSGGFARPFPKEFPLPEHVVALCACRRKLSTGSQLDIAVCEGLAGFADRDADGQVTIGELYAYIPDRYREVMTDEERLNEPQDHMPVLAKSDAIPVDRPLTKATDKRVAVYDDGEWRGGIKLLERPNQTRIQFLGWWREQQPSGYSMPDRAVKNEFLDQLGGFPPVEVETDGVRRPAMILEQQGRNVKVHYLGTAATEDETVPLNRVRFALGGKVTDLERTPGRRR